MTNQTDTTSQASAKLAASQSGQENVRSLQTRGYFAGERDAKFKQGFSGRFMVRDTQDEDGFCIVGDDLNALVHEALEYLEIVHLQEHGNDQVGEVDADEVIVKLADGCTLRSGVYDPSARGALTAGEYVRLCDPDGEEIHYWDKEEWSVDPALVMGAIMVAASGHRIQRFVESDELRRAGM